MCLHNMDRRGRLRLAGSSSREREERANAGGKEKNRMCFLLAVSCDAWLLFFSSDEKKDRGAGNTSSRPECRVVLRYRNEGSSSSSETGDIELCMSACNRRTIREWT